MLKEDVSPVMFFSYPTLQRVLDHFHDFTVTPTEDRIRNATLNTPCEKETGKSTNVPEGMRSRKIEKMCHFYLMSTVIVPYLIEMRSSVHALEHPTSISEFCCATEVDEFRARIFFRILLLLGWMDQSEEEGDVLYSLNEDKRARIRNIPAFILTFTILCYTDIEWAREKIMCSEMKEVVTMFSQNWATEDNQMRSLLTGSILVPILRMLQDGVHEHEKCSSVVEFEACLEQMKSRKKMIVAILVRAGMARNPRNPCLTELGQFFWSKVRGESLRKVLHQTLISFPAEVTDQDRAHPCSKVLNGGGGKYIADTAFCKHVEEEIVDAILCSGRRDANEEDKMANEVPIIGTVSSNFTDDVLRLLKKVISQFDGDKEALFIPADDASALLNLDDHSRNTICSAKKIIICASLHFHDCDKIDNVDVDLPWKLSTSLLMRSDHVGLPKAEYGRILAKLLKIREVTSNILLLQEHPEAKKHRMKKMSLMDLENFLHGLDSLDLRVVLTMVAMAGWFPTKLTRSPAFSVSPKFSMMNLTQEDFHFRYISEDKVDECVRLEAQHWPSCMRTSKDIVMERVRRYPQGQFSLMQGGNLLAIMYSQRINDTEHLKKWKDKEDLHESEGKYVQLLDVFINTDLKQAMLLGGFLRNFVKALTFSDPSVEAIVAVTRGREYQKEKSNMSFEEYTDHVEKKILHDKGLNFHLPYGAHVVKPIPDWRPQDEVNEGYGVLIRYDR